MKVCVIGSGWRFTSGISYYTCRLATTLSAEFDVSAVLMRRLIPRRFYPGRDRVGQPVHELAYPDTVSVFDGVDWYWLPSIAQAVAFLRRERPDVLVLQWWTGAVLHSYLALAVVARRFGARVVIEFHETQDTGEAGRFGAARYLRALGARLIARADAFVVHSQFDQERILAAWPVGDRPVSVIPHGPFDHHAAGDDAQLEPVESDVTTVLFFGTIRPYKGLEHLVEAFSALPAPAASRLRLLVVGETWEGWTRPLELIAQSPHRDRITLVNRYVRDDEVARFFEQSDAVVLPYTRSSASGPLHIAMAHGRPVVLSDVGGLRDGAEGYDGITWVPPADVEALGAALRALPALRGKRYADPRSWGHTLRSYDKIFAELPGGTR